MLMFDASFGLYTIQFLKKFPGALLSWGGGATRVSENFRFYKFSMCLSTFLQEKKDLIYIYNFWYFSTIYNKIIINLQLKIWLVFNGLFTQNRIFVCINFKSTLVIRKMIINYGFS